MRKFYRYEVSVTGGMQALRMWRHAVPMRVEHGPPSGQVPLVEFWAEADDSREAENVTRAFMITGTGQPVPENAHYWGGTSRILGLVWHLYEIFPEGRKPHVPVT